jgi:hypothetical protein
LAASRQLADLGLDVRSAHILRVVGTAIPRERLLVLAMAGPGRCRQELGEAIDASHVLRRGTPLARNSTIVWHCRATPFEGRKQIHLAI